MNYFEFYDLPIAFILNTKALKRKFYTLSKKYHPDFYTLASAEKQAEILELSTFNNEAYKTLSDFDKRMRYVLELENILTEDGKNKIPQSFLMEMMAINEAMMELQFDFNHSTYQQLQQDFKKMETTLNESIEPLLQKYTPNTTSQATLKKIKDFYFKKRYLLRIKENLSKFASL